jgi:hypothetical protein
MKLSVIVAILGLLAAAGTAVAQTDADTSTPKTRTLADRLGDFGRTVFGGARSAEKSQPKALPAKDATASAPRSDAMDPPADGGNAVRAGSVSTGSDEPVKPAAVPLHARLSGYRQSVFDSDHAQPAQTATPPTAQPQRSAAAAATEQAPNISNAASPSSALQPRLAERSPSTVHEETSQRGKPELGAANAQASSATKRISSAHAAGDSVLVAHKSPIIGVDTVGPRTIAVGRESTYQVQLSNSGDVAAEELVVHVTLPDWAEVAGFDASLGTAAANEANQTAGPVVWKVGRLDAKAHERLTLKLIPRQSRPFDLAVRWEYKPIASQAMIEVQEPKFSLAIEGPHEVFYGQKESFRLKLKNTGDGAAENVVIMLTPIGTGENVPASHKIGMLTAGEEKSLDVELTARQPGALTIQADVCADGGAHAELSEKVVVRRGELKIDMEGPKVQFVGGVATYNMHIRNVGNAPARSVRLAIVLPADSRYLSGIEGAKFDAATGRLEWRVERLNPEVEQSFTLKCALATAGISRVRLGVIAADDIIASAETTVQVESIANLTMDVKDPAGPSAVGEEAVYEIHVRNRGTKEAQDVEVFAYFSRGIEPVSAEGAPNRLGAGQVAFQPLVSLAPGAEAVLKIRAKAEVAGNHIFRAETHCKQLGARLVSEATNLYYGDAPAIAQTARNTAPMEKQPSPAYGAASPISTAQAPATP